MNIFTFKKSVSFPDDSFHNVEMEFSEETLDRVIEEFEAFLRGCGYYFDGELAIVSNTEDEQCQCNCESCQRGLFEDNVIKEKSCQRNTYTSSEAPPRMF